MYGSYFKGDPPKYWLSFWFPLKPRKPRCSPPPKSPKPKQPCAASRLARLERRGGPALVGGVKLLALDEPHMFHANGGEIFRKTGAKSRFCFRSVPERQKARNGTNLFAFFIIIFGVGVGGTLTTVLGFPFKEATS